MLLQGVGQDRPGRAGPYELTTDLRSWGHHGVRMLHLVHLSTRVRVPFMTGPSLFSKTGTPITRAQFSVFREDTRF